MSINCKLELDFSHPLQARKWLKIIEPDAISGIRIKPDLLLGENILGFSFNSNEIGLRGKLDLQAETVFSGTSFTMGFGVNNGKNWFNNLKSSYFNIGLPVGPNEHLNLLQTYYRGSYDKLYYFYHPNFWSLATMYNSLQNDYSSLFDKFNWRTKSIDCLALTIKRFLTREAKFRNHTLIRYVHNQKVYIINPFYCYFNFSERKNEVERVINQFQKLIIPFKSVKIIRLNVKEQVVPVQHSYIKSLRENYDLGWELLKSKSESFKAEFEELPLFNLEDFLPKDTHWSELGNLKFAEFLKKNDEF